MTLLMSPSPSSSPLFVIPYRCIMSFGQELNREHITPDMTEMEQQLLYSFKVGAYPALSPSLLFFCSSIDDINLY